MNLKYYLLIFQLEGYRVLRFLRWIGRHYLRFEEVEKKEPVWTTKAKLLYWLAAGLFWISAIYAYATCPFPFSILLIAIFILNTFIFLPLALMLLLPYEITNRLRVKYAIQKKINVLKQSAHLTVIGITGSFGKTSTKMILHELLPKSLITPKSFNTLFGIYKVVDYELNNRYRYFVCEMGAYKRGDVKEFCDLVRPNIGVLTGINEQHLERFGSIENTIQAKFEVLTNTVTGGIGILNLDNQLIRENLVRFNDQLNAAKIKLIGYTTDGHENSLCQEILTIKNWRIESAKTVCELTYKGNVYKLVTPLLGRGHLSNILASIAVSLSCGEDIKQIIQLVGNLKQIPHRLELRSTPGLMILDDTYSSNPSGFREALDVLFRFNDGHNNSTQKILITPGIVELGEKALAIHKEMGALAAKMCDEIVLVGNSANIQAMQESILQNDFQKNKITRLPSRAAVQEFLRGRASSHNVILMENDLPDQYL